jgi:hypothetical protein
MRRIYKLILLSAWFLSAPSLRAAPQQGIAVTPAIHVIVALCDNKYQGIVPVPPKIGNGQDPPNNLYWGCAFGVRSFFKKSSHWSLIRQYAIDSAKLERLVFRHKKTGVYMVADAYNGRYIRQATVDLLRSCAGQYKDTLNLNGTLVGINGNARLLAYVGHDGLMDFQLPAQFKNADGKSRDAIILACYSKRFFGPHLQQSGARALVWSTGLMSPEAYTLHDALEAYLSGGVPGDMRTAAAKAYARYQQCSERAARNLLVSGN